ncbi:MAG: hypothetical protein AAFV77_07305 [Planctomycetota bacterium]
MSTIQLWSGRGFNLANPNPAEVFDCDIAHSLGNICRFTGHTLRNYTVAEHCVRMFWLASNPELMGWTKEATSPELRLACLVHDAHEAYCGDMSAPMKRVVGREWSKVEARISLAVRTALGCDGFHGSVWDDVHEFDMVMLRAERKAMMGPSGTVEWGNIEEVRDVEVDFDSARGLPWSAQWLMLYRQTRMEVDRRRPQLEALGEVRL